MKKFPDINTDSWRQSCGAVMQDGFIFSDTIAKNISMSDDIIDIQKSTATAMGSQDVAIVPVLEEMSDFFNNRAQVYEEKHLGHIGGTVILIAFLSDSKNNISLPF